MPALCWTNILSWILFMLAQLNNMYSLQIDMWLSTLNWEAEKTTFTIFDLTLLGIKATICLPLPLLANMMTINTTKDLFL